MGPGDGFLGGGSVGGDYFGFGWDLLWFILSWIEFHSFDWRYFAGLHWEDRRRRRRRGPDAVPDNFTGFNNFPSLIFYILNDNLRLNEWMTSSLTISNQSNSGWDDEDRWSSEDEHNYEVKQAISKHIKPYQVIKSISMRWHKRYWVIKHVILRWPKFANI